MKKEFIKAILAGVMVGIGAVVYLSLSMENKFMASFLFSIGLISICCLQFNLFTGKVGYVIENKQWKTIGMIWCGNFVGTILVSSLIKYTRIFNKIYPALEIAMSPRLTDTHMSLFVLAIFCGLLMFIAVEIYKTSDSIYGLAAILLCVSVFILSGYEHSIANMAYFTLYGWDMDLLLRLIIITLGNSIGGMIIPLCKKIASN